MRHLLARMTSKPSFQQTQATPSAHSQRSFRSGLASRGSHSIFRQAAVVSPEASSSSPHAMAQLAAKHADELAKQRASFQQELERSMREQAAELAKASSQQLEQALSKWQSEREELKRQNKAIEAQLAAAKEARQSDQKKAQDA